MNAKVQSRVAILVGGFDEEMEHRTIVPDVEGTLERILSDIGLDPVHHSGVAPQALPGIGESGGRQIENTQIGVAPVDETVHEP